MSDPITIIGHRWAPDVHEAKDFLARSLVPYRWLDLERDAEAREYLDRYAPGERRFPVLVFPDGGTLVAPSERELAERLGLDTQPEHSFYDLIIIGGGPAGLSAAVYAASEGLRTVIVERELPGGQAGHSARIENYLGFPDGLSGSDLAQRAIAQAERFGASVLVTRSAASIRRDGPYRFVGLDDGSELAAYCVLVATGVALRWLEAPGCADLIGAGIYYGAATAEGSTFTDQDVFILGGGNSAGQAALELARHARHVTMLVLEESLEQTMSSYLVARIQESERITVRTNHTVIAASGRGHLERIEVEDVGTGERSRITAHGLFVFIGTTPQTDWLARCLSLDEAGFVRSGEDFADGNGGRPDSWSFRRAPYPFETSLPGVFVAGDVRNGSVKRLATAAGEGAAAVQFIHRYISER